MKSRAGILVGAIVALAVAVALGVNHKSSSKSVAANSPIHAAPGVGLKPPSPPPVFSTSLKPNEWQELRADRDTTLKTDSELASEYNALVAEMAGQQKDLESAMIKIDPKAAPILAKLALIRKHVPTPGGTTSAPKIYMPTPTELRQIQTARQAALKANPDFNQRALQLAAKMRTFQQKLDAAMVKADPNVEPIMAKFEAGRPAPAATAPPTKTE